MKQPRGPKHENWPVCDPRAAPPGVVSGENEPLARANGAIDGPYCSPTWPSVFGRRCEPLAGESGGGFGGGELHQRPHRRRVGRFFIQFECPTKKNARCPGLRPSFRSCSSGGPGAPGWLGLLPCSQEGGGANPLLFTTYRPCQMCKKKFCA
jgi:hypothetical protein